MKQPTPEQIEAAIELNKCTIDVGLSLNKGNMEKFHTNLFALRFLQKAMGQPSEDVCINIDCGIRNSNFSNRKENDAPQQNKETVCEECGSDMIFEPIYEPTLCAYCEYKGDDNA